MTIYMPLLNEGTDVSRPVIALKMENDIYKILGTENGLTPEDLDEEWLFPIGSFVLCKFKEDGDNKVLIVNALAQYVKTP